MADPTYIDATTGALTDGEAWVAIAHESLSLPAATVTWTSTNDGQTGDFSQYLDMKIITYAKGTTSSVNGNLCLRFNNDDDNAYSYQVHRGNGNGSTSWAGTAGPQQQWDAAEMPGSPSGQGSVFGTAVIDLFDINSGKWKSGIAMGGAGINADTNSYVTLYTTCWNKIEAITEIDIFSRNLGNFVANSTFSLFGILPRMVYGG
tara:strand:- start:488 stop:1099 length:612 start_codon:yes stop_codon:yes gene_type:complete